MKKVIERTSSMLDTPPQDKLYRRLQVFNTCEHSCIMMVMGGSKMPLKQNTTLRPYVSCPWHIPKNCVYNIQQPRLPPNDAGKPVRQFKSPLAWLKVENRVSPCTILFSREVGRHFMRGTQSLTQGSDHMRTEWGNTTRHTSTEKYTSENIHAICQSSVGYLAW